jgi:hypothetical protein
MNQTALPIVAAALALASSVAFADTIDQDASTNNAFMASFSQHDLAQSFQQAADNVSGAGVFLQAGQGNTGAVTISLYDKLPTNGGALLAQGSGTGTQGSWFDVLWAPVSVVANTTYFLVFTGDAALGLAGDTNNGYARGNVFANNGFSSFNTYDYTFRTYNDVGAVPEPETYALMLAGLAGIAALARRRKTGADAAQA